MKLTILGCTGSVGSAVGPSSGYLLQDGERPAIVMDIGSGVMAELERRINPADAHVLFSHLHSDHCADFPSLLVWRRFHPTHKAEGRHLLFGPPETPGRMGRLISDDPEGIDDITDTFAFGPWHVGTKEIVEGFTVEPFHAIHPIDAYALRLTHRHSGTVLAYSGDSSATDDLVECAHDADLFICEATWGASSAGQPADMHMSGGEAGDIARRAGAKKLLITHIPPWGDREGAVSAAKAEFPGEVLVARPGLSLEL